MAFGLIPLAELFIKPDPRNVEKTEEELIKKDSRYDLVLYTAFFLQFAFLFMFLHRMGTEISTLETVGLVFSFGISCGVMGINVAHELGHRKSKAHQGMAKMLLMTSLYMHFFIEHNRGHHLRVGTDDDPASARKGGIHFRFLDKNRST